MRTKEEILEELEANTLNTEFLIYTKENVLHAMEVHADEFACGFAEWKVNNASDFCEANSFCGQSLKRGQWIYFKDGHKDRIVTTTELLEIYKQQINGL